MPVIRGRCNGNEKTGIINPGKRNHMDVPPSEPQGPGGAFRVYSWRVLTNRYILYMIAPKGRAIMNACKNCKSEKVVKSGNVRGKQRYKCRECGYNFVIGDKRTNEKIVAMKALCVLLYSLGKGSYNMWEIVFS